VIFVSKNHFFYILVDYDPKQTLTFRIVV